MDIAAYMEKIPDLKALLQELPPQMLEQIETKHYAAGDVLIYAGRYEDCLYVILQGVCEVRRPAMAGMAISYYKISVMDVIGLSELYDTPKKRRWADVIAKTDVVVAAIPLEVLMASYGVCPNFSIQLSLRVINRLHTSIGLLSECNNYPLFGSVVTYLIHSYHFYHRQYPVDYEGAVKIGESRQEMAYTIGVDVRSINRVIEKLKSGGHITVVHGKIHITRNGFVTLSSYTTINL